VYLSDEFYLLAGKPVPGSRFYADFPQVGNGIGMTRQFLDAFKRGLPKLRRVFSKAPQRVLTADVVTGLLPSGFVLECVRDLNASIPNLDLTPHVVLNDWYGKDITASGLLVGRDIEREFRANGLHGRSVLLPPNVLNDDELFLDDMHLHDLQTNLGVPVVVGSYDLIASVEALWWDSDKPMRKGLRSLAVLEDRGPSETMCAI
jgi:NifB/MoaA-like Fe-S oxidoreductase